MNLFKIFIKYKFICIHIFLLDDEDKIWIDNQAIPKANVDIIAKKILRNCNFSHDKKYKENLTRGNGKMMITSGLTVQEFSRKFKIPI